MTAIENLSQFLEQQYEKGLALWLEQGQLRFKGPKSVLSKDLIQVLKNHKPAIMAMLAEEDCLTISDVAIASASSVEPNEAVKRTHKVASEYPLSMSQAAIWMLYRFAPDSPAYNTTFCAKLGAKANLEVMEKSYQNVLNRHPMLRSRFLDGPNGAVQQVMHESDNVIERISACDWSEEEIEQWLAKEATSPFDLGLGQPLRTKCLETASGNILIATIHHVAADLWSLLLIAGDLFEDYRHYEAHGYFDIKRSPHSYQQHVEWQQTYMQSDDVIKVKSFWKNYLQHALVQTDMPTDYPRPPIMRMSTERHSTKINRTTYDKVKAYCKQRAITPYVLFSSAFQILLYRYLRQSDFLVGTPTFGRSTQATESIVGDFANPVVLRARIDLDQPIASWLKQNQKDLFKVMALQDFPFPALVDVMNPPRDASRTPLFQHMFVWHQGNKDTFMQQGLIEDILPLSGPCGSPYDILLSVSDLGDGFECHWTYQDSLYQQQSIMQFATEFDELIDRLLAVKGDATTDEVIHTSVNSCVVKGSFSVALDMVAQDNLCFYHRPLSNTVSPISEDNTAEECGFFLKRNDVALSTLHIEGQLIAQRSSVGSDLSNHNDELALPLPLHGYYCAEGRIHITKLSPGWGIVDHGLVDLRGVIREALSGRHIPLFETYCSVSVNGHAINALYMESLDDELVAYLTKNCPEFHDIVSVPRIEYQADGEVNRRWLSGIPIFNQTQRRENGSDDIAILRVADNLFPEQHYPQHHPQHIPHHPSQGHSLQKVVNPTPINQAVSAVNEAAYMSNGTPALIVGKPLVNEIAENNIVASFIRTVETNKLTGRTTGLTFVGSDGHTSSVPYSELLIASRMMAQVLTQRGVGSGEVVVLQVSDPQQFFTSWWALVWIGAMPLTIAVPPRYDDEQPIARKVKQVVNNLASCIVLTDTELALSDYVDCRVLSLSDISAQCVSSEFVEDYCRNNSVAFLQLTSGSTGTPKVIQIAHKGILHQVYAAAQHNGFQPSDRTLNWLPYDHVVPLLTTHLRDVVLGLEQYQVPTHYILEDPLRWLDLMVIHQIQHSWSPNFGYKLIVDEINNGSVSEVRERIGSLSSIKTLMNAGEQVTHAVATEFATLLQPYGLTDQCMQPSFGMAESCTCITYQNGFDANNPVLRSVEKQQCGANQESSSAFVSLGDVIPGIEIRITDNNNLLLKEGQIGRMQIRGPVVTPGYLNNPEANADAFTGNGWFNSGDLGFVRHNQLVLTGREKETIIVRGTNFYCYEIEESLTTCSNTSPTFIAAFSIVLDDQEQLIVCYVPADTGLYEQDVAELNGIISGVYGIEARYIIALEKHEFHKTTSGKIQRSQFKALFERGAYKNQCTSYEGVLRRDLIVPYQLYRAGWQAIPSKIDIVESPKGVENENHTLYCFDPVLMDYVSARCKRFTSKIGQDGIDAHSSKSITLLFMLPFVLETEQTLSLANSITQAVLNLSRPGTEGSVKESCTVDIVLVGAIDECVAQTQWVKPLIDALSAEQSHGRFQYRLRIISEHAISDQTFIQLGQYQSISDPLLLRGGQLYRSALTASDLAIASSESRFDSVNKKTYVVVGGLGGIGLKVVEYLLERQCHIVVIGRRSMNDADISESVKHLRDRCGGNTVSYRTVPTLTEGALDDVVGSALSEQGIDHLDGVFHLAGCYQETPLSEMAAKDWQVCVDAKYQGSIAIGRYLESHWPEASLIFFSSINSYFGAGNLAGYGVANALQNQLADYFNHDTSLRVYSLNWSQWPELGMANAFSSQDLMLAKNKGFLPMNASRDLEWLPAVLGDDPGNYWFGLDHRKSTIASEISGGGHAIRWNVRAFFDDAIDSCKVEQWVQDNKRSDVITLPEVDCQTIALSQGLPITANGTLMYSALGELKGTTGVEGEGPRNDTDRVLLELWQSLLGNRVVHIDQTFFECGGNSVVVTQLGYKLTLRLQRQLPMSSIFEYPTIRSYSDYLGEFDGETREPSSALAQALASITMRKQVQRLDQDNLTLLSSNNPGSENTIIYLPALVGLSHSYQHLLKQFDQCNQVLIGQDMLSQSVGSVESLAKRYIALLEREAVDTRHCVLVGWSFGGCVAYEMASQMQSADVDVIMLDSAVQDAIPSFLTDNAVVLPLFAKDLGLAPSSLGNAANTNLTQSLRSLLPDLSSFGVELTEQRLAKWFEGYKNNMKALQRYKCVQKPKNNVVYLRAKGNPLGTDTMGWGDDFASFTCIDIEADHQKIMYDQQLVEWIDGRLGENNSE